MMNNTTDHQQSVEDILSKLKAINWEKDYCEKSIAQLLRTNKIFEVALSTLNLESTEHFEIPESVGEVVKKNLIAYYTDRKHVLIEDAGKLMKL